MIDRLSLVQSPCTTSGQETERVHSYNPGARTGHKISEKNTRSYQHAVNPTSSKDGVETTDNNVKSYSTLTTINMIVRPGVYRHFNISPQEFPRAKNTTFQGLSRLECILSDFPSAIFTHITVLQHRNLHLKIACCYKVNNISKCANVDYT